MVDETLKGEVLSPLEKPKTPFVKTGFANPEDYQYANKQGKTQQLEDAERALVMAIIKVSETFDKQAPILLGEDYQPRLVYSQELLEKFEEAVRHLNPKGKQLPAKSGRGEVIEPREELEFRWQYVIETDYQSVRQKHGHAGFLALRLIEHTALSDLHQGWMNLEKVRQNIGLSSSYEPSANRSPYLWAENDLKKRLVNLEIEELKRILQSKTPPFEFGSPETSQEARQKAFEKLKADLPFSIVKDKFDVGVLKSSTDREIHTFTIDPKTKIRFITKQGFRRGEDKEEFEPWGTIGISGFGPNREIYYLSPDYYAPKYSPKAGRQSWDSFRPFYRSQGSYSGVAPSLSEEKQMEIWEAYGRAVCDVEETEKEFRRETEWRYGLDRICWGIEIPEIRLYENLKEKLKMAKLLQEAVSSEFGKVRLGIRLSEGSMEGERGVVEISSKEQLRLIQELFAKYWQNPEESKMAHQADKSWGYLEFGYPYGESGGTYPDDYGKVIKVRLSKDKSTGVNEILIRDAYDQDIGIGATSYLKTGWDEKDNWKIERGRYESTADAYHLWPKESKTSLSKRDAEILLLIFKLLSQPKQKRR